MPTLHVRNVPEPLYERLRLRAHEQNRSLSAEVISILDRALQDDASSQETLLAEIRRRRSYSPAQAGAPDTTVMLREARNR